MRPSTWSHALLTAVVAALVLAAACGGGSDQASDDDDGDGPAARKVLLEPASSTGPDPFTESVAGETDPIDARDDGGIQPANAPGLYGGTGDPSTCDQQQLVEFLDETPDKADAWAGALGIDPTDIGAFVDTLTPTVLQVDTQVTNHGFAGGVATPRQSVLEAGTAVLVDQLGVPRTRCACGNPLLEPVPVADPVYEGEPWAGWEPPPTVIVPPVPGEAPPAGLQPLPEPIEPVGPDFCTVVEEGRPTVEGGPSGPGDILAYLARLEVYFADLISAAEATPGFPEDALADMRTYHDQIVAAIESGDPSSIAGSTALRDQLEAFLEEFCTDPPETTEPPPVADPEPTSDDDRVPRAECGSFMFSLLANVAEGLGLEWESVAAPYVDEMEALYAEGLPAMIEYEEVGCEGAVALYDLLVDAGYGDEIEGTDLDPFD